jgi:predicted transcriptional regulator of viral defense system
MLKTDIEIRNQIQREEFDVTFLTEVLKDYADPPSKIKDLLERKVIIQVVRGLYIFGPEVRRRPYSREILANLIYGPSYISLEYALSYYGLIPERVETVTSVTQGRSRSFSTTVGDFTYRMISSASYSTGIDLVKLDDQTSFLIATPEKALADKIFQDKGVTVSTRAQIEDYLYSDLRLDENTLANLSLAIFQEAALRYRSRKLMSVLEYLRMYGKK